MSAGLLSFNTKQCSSQEFLGSAETKADFWAKTTYYVVRCPFFPVDNAQKDTQRINIVCSRVFDTRVEWIIIIAK